MTDLPAAVEFIRARLDEVGEGPATSALRDVMEWALGIEELRAWGDAAAPLRPLGAEVLGIIAAGWATHPDYDPRWDVLADGPET